MSKPKLTDEQEAIISAKPNRDYRVMAVAGSGKTSVITEYAATLLDKHDVSPHEILMTTFSVDAAREMSKRLKKQSKQGGAVTVSTLHSVCLKILRTAGSAYSARRVENWPVWKTRRCIREMIARQVSADELARWVDNLKSVYEATKRHPIGEWVGAFAKTYCQKTKVSYQTLVEVIDEAKEEENGIDFDDMAQLALLTLQTKPKIREKWQAMYKYIIVDEFQDTDPCQYEILMLLAEKANIMVVGDVDQCIYTWRGANPRLLDEQVKIDRKIHDMPLTVNFRSHPKILEIANNIVSRSSGRKLVPFNTDKPGIVYYNENWTFHKLQEVIDAGCPLHEIAVLNRYNAQSQGFEAECIKKKIPYVVHGPYSMHDSSAVKAGIAYLRLVYGEDEPEVQNEAFKEIYNIPTRKIPRRTIDKITAAANTRTQSVIEYIRDRRGEVTDKRYINNALNTLAQDLLNLRGMIPVRKLKMPEVLGMISETFSFLTHFESSEDQNDNPAACLNNLKKVIEDFTGIPDLNSFEKGMQKLKGKSNHKNKVHILTGHKAKGQEYDVVFIHAPSGTFPAENSCLLEERRLLYVMVTRARKAIFLSGESQYLLESLQNVELNSNPDLSQLWCEKNTTKRAKRTPLFDFN